MTAARTGDAGIVRLLLEVGAVAHATAGSAAQTALMWASAEGHADVVRVLLEAGATVDARSAAGSTAFLFAAQSGDVETARLLVDAGSTLDAAATDTDSPFVTQQSPDGATALMIAVAGNHQPLVTFLLERGADPNIRDGMAGRTAPHAAVEHGRADLVEVLLRHGADPNVQYVADLPQPRGAFGRWPGLMGATPLYLAARRGDETVMSMLAEHGADVNLPDAEGITPLMAAVRPGRRGEPSDDMALNRLSSCWSVTARRLEPRTPPGRRLSTW